MKNNFVMPHDFDIEEYVISAIIYDNNILTQFADSLREEFFYFPAHRQLYLAAIALNAKGAILEPLTVRKYLEQQNLLDAVGGQEKLNSYIATLAIAAFLEKYISELKAKYLRRKIIENAFELAGLAADEANPLDFVVESGEKKMFEISEMVTSAKDGFVMASEFIPRVFTNILKVKAGEIPKGTPTGFYDLDAMLMGGGIHPGQLIFIAGRASMGKSTFALNIAHNICAQVQKRVAFVSYEMTEDQVGYTLISKEAEVSRNELLSTETAPERDARIVEAVGNLSDAKFSLWRTSDSDISTFKSYARKEVANANRSEGIGAIVIDYVQLMEAKGYGNQRVAELSYITRQLKLIAIELKVPLIVLAQLNRKIDERADKHPVLSDLKDSGSLEQDADTVLMLYRPEYYDPNTTDQGIVEVCVSKQREGPRGVIVKLLLDANLGIFRNRVRDNENSRY